MIVEYGELKGICDKGTSREAAKQFLSKKSDYYRASYDKSPVLRPRTCVFFGSTNNRNYLSGDDGNRRFVTIEALDISPEERERNWNNIVAISEDDVKQFWAFIREEYKKDSNLYFTREEYKQLEKDQEEHNEANTDDTLEAIRAYCEQEFPADWNKLTAYQMESYLKDPERWHEAHYNTQWVKRDVFQVKEIAMFALGQTAKRNDYTVARLERMVKLGEMEKASRTRSLAFGLQVSYRYIKLELN